MGAEKKGVKVNAQAIKWQNCNYYDLTKNKCLTSWELKSESLFLK